MPSFWPFGRNKRKKQLNPAAAAQEQLPERYNASSSRVHTRTISSTTGIASRPVEESDLQHEAITEHDPVESLSSAPSNRHASNLQNHTINSSESFNSRLSSVSSTQNREPLVEVDVFAGAIHHGNSGISEKAAQEPLQSEFGAVTISQPQNAFASTPTLRPQRSANTAEAIRARSTKSRSSFKEKEREREFQSQTPPVPLPPRPASFISGVLSRGGKRASKEVVNRINSPDSALSSSMVQTRRTSVSGEAGAARSYKVSALDALAPRPTIRYGQSPRLATVGEPTLKTSKRKEKSRALQDQLQNPRRRIKELANDLDASEIRQLMERDQRRRDRRKMVDHEQLKRKLEESLLQQKAQEIAAEPVELEGSPVELGTITPLQEPEIEPGTITPLPEPEVEHGTITPLEEPQLAPAKIASLPEPLFEDIEADEEEDIEDGRITPLPELETPNDEDGRITPLLDDGRITPLQEQEMDEDDAEPPAIATSSRRAVPPSWTRTKSIDDSIPVGPPPDIPMRSPERPMTASRRTTATETSIPWQSESRRLSSEQISIRDDAIIDTATAVRLSTISMSPPASPVVSREPTMRHSMLSNMAPLASHPPDPSHVSQAADIQPIPRKASQTNVKESSPWTSIFRRIGTKRKASVGKDKEPAPTTEFSNLSRESFLRKNQPASAPVVQRSFTRGEPTLQRKQSKFREHLPERSFGQATELPVSPPRSRIQSPEPDSPPFSPYLDDTRKLDQFINDETVTTPLEDVHPALREQVTRSREQSFQGPQLDIAMLSQSLASIDSEGSWLSGKPQKRSSAQITESMVSLDQLEEPEQPDFTRRDLAENTAAVSGGLSSQLRNLQSGIPVDMASTGEDGQFPFDADVKYDAVHGHHPNIMQRVSVARSREGILDEFPPYDDDSPVSPLSPGEAPDSPEAGESSIHRATSVSVKHRGGIGRHLNAGSARLLDIPPRSSSDTKRSSQVLSGSDPQSPVQSSLQNPIDFRPGTSSSAPKDPKTLPE